MKNKTTIFMISFILTFLSIVLLKDFIQFFMIKRENYLLLSKLSNLQNPTKDELLKNNVERAKKTLSSIKSATKKYTIKNFTCENAQTEENINHIIHCTFQENCNILLPFFNFLLKIKPSLLINYFKLVQKNTCCHLDIRFTEYSGI